MLKSLEIQNYAIIDKLEITFPSGLAIITGETGAGKSILLGALGLIMGKRADTKVLYDQERKCYVEAVFDIKPYALIDFFTYNELEYNDETTIRREIAPGGKSRAFINDTPVTLDVIQQLCENLIDIHQQFDTQDIQQPSFQIKMIDALADNKQLLEQYSFIYKSYRNNKKKLDELITKNRNAHQEIEYLKFQMAEFNQAELKEGEQDTLETLLHKLTSAEDIKKNNTLLTHGLEEDENAIINQLQSLIYQYGSIKNLDKSYMNLYERLISVKEELSDISKDAGRIADATEYDEEQIQILTARLNLINRLQKKHGVVTIDELLKVEAEIQHKLNSFSDLSNEMVGLEKEIHNQDKELRGIAQNISKNRKKIIPEFEKNVHNLLEGLSMQHAYIKVHTSNTEDLTPNGLDVINIHFAPNKGSNFLPLKDTVSGGEMSRLALCIKSLVAGATTLATLIFDEIDSGVSGDVAQKMGLILHQLSKKHQVISITHSPQIAAKAESHYWVYKTDTENRTITSMKVLSQEERVTEIAKMLSGNPPSEAARANARELIGL
jgi:DNA repair protein RecN (Recombination protein N)